MTRKAVAFDRVMTLIVGAVLAGLGAGAIAWHQGALGGGGPLKVYAVDLMDTAWWPWVSGGAGLVLALVGLRWLVAHRWAPKASKVGLDGSDPGLTADAAAVAGVAAGVLKSDPAVVKSSCHASIVRAVPTITLGMTVPARHGVGAAVRLADDTAQVIAAMLGEAVAVRTVVRTDISKRTVVR